MSRGAQGQLNVSEMGPDNRCCVCLTLGSGSVLVAVLNALAHFAIFAWYATAPAIQSGWTHNTRLNDLDISICIVFVVQLGSNWLLAMAVSKRDANLTLPWLCTNAAVLGILMFLVLILLIFGYRRLSLNYSEYVGFLGMLSTLTGAHVFSCLVVFQLRKNLIEEGRVANALCALHASNTNAFPHDANESGLPRVPSPPPCYDEVCGSSSADCGKNEENSDSKLMSPPHYDQLVLPRLQSI